MALRPEQLAALLAAKLRALVTEAWPERGIVVAKPFTAGAGLVAEPEESGGAGAGWVLVDVVHRSVENIDIAADATGPELPRGWLGGAVVWAMRSGVSELHALADHLNGDDARRARLFSLPITLWRVSGRSIAPVSATIYTAPQPPDAVEMLFAEAIAASGADAVVDHGVLRAEVLGLEVATVTRGDDGVPYLAVGVGRHDRLAQAMMYGAADSGTSLRTAVEAVRNFRRGDAGVHPANQLAPERWLRCIVAASDPSLGPVESTEPARLKHSSPAMLIDRTGDLVVACTTAVDLDAVAVAADTRAVLAPDADLRMVMPKSSLVPAMELLVAALREPASIQLVDDAWRSVGMGDGQGTSAKVQ